MIKTIIHEGKTIEFKCILINHPHDEEPSCCKYCKLEALGYSIKDYLKDTYLCPHYLEKVIIKVRVVK